VNGTVADVILGFNELAMGSAAAASLIRRVRDDIAFYIFYVTSKINSHF